jgi:signal peptidase I
MLVMMAALWIVLAPRTFGGQASYVLVAGASMEPTLRRGDLVVVREAQIYEVGDIVTYRHPSIGPIIHRIIDRQGDRYTFKGDNNEWIDSYQPSSSEIVGKEWIHLPGAATWLLKLRTPAGLALLSLSIALMLMMTFINTSWPSKTGGKDRGVMGRERFIRWTDNLNGAFFALGTVAFGAFLLGLFAFSRPITTQVPDDIPFEHHGQFTYHAGAPPSIYDGGKLTTGDPVFYHLVPEFDVEFQYHLISQASSNLHGTASMSVQVSDASGWNRAVELVSQTDFAGPDVVLKSTVDIERLLSLTEALQERTGTQRQVFNVDIIPEIDIEGSVDGQPFKDHFAPELGFQFDQIELYLRGADPLTSQVDPLFPSSGGFLPRFRSEPAVLPILGIDVPVETSRWIAGVGFFLGVAGMLALWLGIRGISRRDRATEIRLEFGPLLVEVEELELKPGLKQTDVRSMEDLAKLAERSGGMILHMDQGGEHTYCLQVGEICYRYILLAPVEDPTDLDGNRPAGNPG